MNKTKEEIRTDRHQQMLAYQKEKPVPPMRDLENIWELASTSAVSYVLKSMAKRGMVKTIQNGKYKKYYAVDITEVENASSG